MKISIMVSKKINLATYLIDGLIIYTEFNLYKNT